MVPQGNIVREAQAGEELDHITDSRRWTEAVCQKFSDDYVAKLIELNPATSTAAEEGEDRGKSIA